MKSIYFKKLEKLIIGKRELPNNKVLHYQASLIYYCDDIEQIKKVINELFYCYWIDDKLINLLINLKTFHFNQTKTRSLNSRYWKS